VDDDPLVARSLAKLLARDHDVELSHEPRGVALRILAGESFDVILCDLMMPEMTGMDLHAAIAEKCPEQAQRIVFVTGGVFTPAARSFVGRTSNKVLEKPFDLKQLRAALAEQLRRIPR
jgi:CheY-like chemotaxis protein